MGDMIIDEEDVFFFKRRLPGGISIHTIEDGRTHTEGKIMSVLF